MEVGEARAPNTYGRSKNSVTAPQHLGEGGGDDAGLDDGPRIEGLLVGCQRVSGLGDKEHVDDIDQQHGEDVADRRLDVRIARSDAVG